MQIDLSVNCNWLQSVLKIHLVANQSYLQYRVCECPCAWLFYSIDLKMLLENRGTGSDPVLAIQHCHC